MIVALDGGVETPPHRVLDDVEAKAPTEKMSGGAFLIKM